MNISNFFKRKSFYTVALSVLVSVAFVAFAASAATTISTNISTGGTLSVSGDADFDTNTLYVDVSTNRVGFGSTTPGTAIDVSGSVHLTGGLSVGAVDDYNTQAATIVFAGLSSNPTADEGILYYDTSENVFKFYDGTSFLQISTTTNDGFTITAPKITLGSTDTYVTIGTSTQQGLSTMTLAATTSSSFPLTIEEFVNPTTAGTGIRILDAGGTAQITLGPYGEAVFNEAASSSDFRIEGNTDTHNFFSDASADRIGVGTSTPGLKFSVAGAGLFQGIVNIEQNLQAANITATGTLSSTATAATSTITAGLTVDTTTLVVDYGGNKVGIGTVPTTTAPTLFEVFSSATTTVTIDSSSATQGGCLKVMDIDGKGYSYGYVLNGAVTWSTRDCSQ